MIKASFFSNELTYPRCNHGPRSLVPLRPTEVTWVWLERFLMSVLLKPERHASPLGGGGLVKPQMTRPPSEVLIQCSGWPHTSVFLTSSCQFRSHIWRAAALGNPLPESHAKRGAGGSFPDSFRVNSGACSPIPNKLAVFPVSLLWPEMLFSTTRKY